MPETFTFFVSAAAWPAEAVAIARVRRAVFIEEQAVPEALEWEELDRDCAWFVARLAGGEVIGTARLTPDGRIGRMAVLPSWRGGGVGTALLGAALSEARRRGASGVRLSAQTHAVPFYARLGFHAQGEVYQDAGIPHVAMTYTFEESQ